MRKIKHILESSRKKISLDLYHRYDEITLNSPECRNIMEEKYGVWFTNSGVIYTLDTLRQLKYNILNGIQSEISLSDLYLKGKVSEEEIPLYEVTVEKIDRFFNLIIEALTYCSIEGLNDHNFKLYDLFRHPNL